MKKKALLGLLSLCLVLVSTSCKDKAKVEEKTAAAVEGTVQIPEAEVLTNTVLTAAEQAALTPADVLNLLKEGNKEFTEDNLTVRNNTQRVRDAATGQFPKAAILSCLDSRVPVEDVFHRGIGDLFVARIAGNIVNEDVLGSFEFATKVSGAKVIVVLGHEYCGAVMSAIDDVKLGNITALLAKIKPAVASAGKTFEGEKTAANPAFVEAVCDHNVELAIEQLRTKSPILKEMEDKGELLIVGGVYDMKTGKVNFFDKK
ncbi:carbonic anhydrase [Dysgonomonas alginatilytica]|uniref:Carbonic anhydrase n=1 Tax=Dysgonomonas alginatilytica TaxID=1605892 RepID=A0A2V3PLA4_9BACT|nr:carbonic anhydrase family protein [Dysgonomonas alginatilytica]PXV60920.1 carbonic anhydrase [Dysgonomonas alginatilytica]